MKNIVVVGGTKGIGEAIVQLLGDAQVFVVARSEQASGASGNVSFIHADVVSGELPTAGLPEVIDGFVYCPGSINLKPFHRLSDADFQGDWNINFLGAVKTLQVCLPALKRSDAASVVLFSTVAVGSGMPFHASIAAAKGAVEGLARSLAAELAPKIRVNCIAPSLINTGLAEIGRAHV